MISPSIIISEGWDNYEYDTDELEYRDMVDSELEYYYNCQDTFNEDIFDEFDNNPYVSWEEEYELFCEQQSTYTKHEDLEFDYKFDIQQQSIIKRKDKINNKRKKHVKDDTRWVDSNEYLWNSKRIRSICGCEWCVDNRLHKHLRAQKVYDEGEYYFNDNTSYDPEFIDQFGEVTYYEDAYYYDDCGFYIDMLEMYDSDIEDYNWYCREGNMEHLATDFDWQTELNKDTTYFDRCYYNFVLTRYQAYWLGYDTIEPLNINFEEVDNEVKEFTDFFDQFK